MAKTPLVQLLVVSLEHRVDGTLILESPDNGKCTVYFSNGAPCKVRTRAIVSPLGATMLKMLLIDEETLVHAMRSVARSKQLLGNYLLARSLVDHAELQRALRQQLINKLGYALTLGPSTRYAFYDDVDLLADYGGLSIVECDPLTLIMMGVRKSISEAAIDVVFMALRKPLVLHPDADPERLGLTDREREVLTRLRAGPATVDELLAAASDESSARQAIYALVITRCIDLSKGTREPIGSEQGGVG